MDMDQPGDKGKKMVLYTENMTYNFWNRATVTPEIALRDNSEASQKKLLWRSQHKGW